jgi:hypothetical protein
MTKEALKIALEALELHGKQYPHMVKGYCLDAITAIKEALANEALDKMAENARELGLDYEPVAWRAWVSKFPQGTGSDWVYVTKPIMKDSIHNQPLYTTPPQRTWVGLTDDEIEHAFKTNSVMVDNGNAYMVAGLRAVNIAQAIEAKLKEKNT